MCESALVLSKCFCCMCLSVVFMNQSVLVLYKRILGMGVIVCVCLCGRARERERESVVQYNERGSPVCASLL